MHRLHRWAFFGLIVGLFGYAVRAGATDPEPEYLTVRNGLPQGSVKSIIQDRRGFIWMATRDGLCRYDGIQFRIYTHNPQQSHSLSFSSIYEIKEDKRGQLWVRTENNNIDCFDPITEQSRRIGNSSAFREAVGRSQLVGMFPDEAGNVWVATQTNGFFRLKANGTIDHQYWAMHGDTVQRVLRSLLLDRQGHVWLAARDGLFQYTPATGQFSGYRIAQGLPQNDIFNLHERANGELMLGFPGRFALFNPATKQARAVLALPGSPTALPFFTSSPAGVDYVNQSQYTDKSGLMPAPADPKLAQFPVQSLLIDRTNVLWMGLDGDGVIKYNLTKRPFQTWPYVTNFQTDWLTQQLQIPIDAIPAEIRQTSPFLVRYQFDRRKSLWLSTSQNAPYRYEAGQQAFIPVRPLGIEPRWLSGGAFRLTAITTDLQGEIWGLLGPSNQAVVRYNPDKQTFTAFPLPLPPNHPYVITAMLVDGGRVYLATENHGLLRADLSLKRLIRWHNVTTDPQSLPGDALLCLAQDPLHYNYLWIGTFGSGLCRLDKLTGKIQQFTVGQGLPHNVIYAIRSDRNGHLWMSTNRGLCRFDIRTSEVRSYMADDGLPSEEFRRYHDVALPDGRLIFGGIGGYTAFDPGKISEDAYKPRVTLTGLRINNQLMTPNQSDSPIQQVINESPEITLDHQQNFLSFDFSALEYNQSYKNQYRYKLIGLDNDWIYSGNQATATYTNLSPTPYTFVVNASNTSGIWSPYNHQLRVIINPPLWATWWAYAGYVLLVLGSIIVFLRVRIHRIHLQSRVELREQESIQLKQLNEVKSRFFSNITHEFRTPLTLILSPLEQLLKEVHNTPYYDRLNLIYLNASRLLRLINELLDLAKLDAGNLTVTPTPGDLAEFVDRIVLTFMEEAQRKQIQLRITSNLQQPYYWFDADKLEKILNNLLSNALKFSDDKGTVVVSINARPNSGVLSDSSATDIIQLTVHNTGRAIPDHQLPYIFNRFYQVDPSAERISTGSGIGLSLVKELVEVMQGTISVKSPQHLGTSFVVEIPCRPARKIPSVTSSVDGDGTVLLPATDHANNDGKAVPTAKKTARLLLVEDNDDLADYISSVLNEEWRVQRADNGLTGLEAAIATNPDLIVSDVLMPEMDGYELCRQLKGNPITSHIPVLLLTAKASIDSRIEGLTAGADDYLAKPFQVEELRARVRNRLDQQQRTRQHYRNQLLHEGHLPVASQNPDDEFMNRIYEVLEARLDDSTFGVEPLADAVGLSRMHLNRKIKAITDMTPNELIRVVRLTRAAELLLTGVSVSEVADRVGFDTPAYFSKVFKDHYHLTPSEYVDKNRQQVA
jgi:signal transduction histidine kinase/CheY-like chemotaxis protein/ligand-binding sensor domain-containing protein